jgi:hypothetical protein
MARMEIMSGTERRRRRRWSDEAKLRIMTEADQPGVRIGDVARRNDIHPGQIRLWRQSFKRLEDGALPNMWDTKSPDWFRPPYTLFGYSIGAPVPLHRGPAASGNALHSGLERARHIRPRTVAPYWPHHPRRPSSRVSGDATILLRGRPALQSLDTPQSIDLDGT